MNSLTIALTYIYSKLLLLYPSSFQDEFVEEMQVVFRDSLIEALHEGALSFLFICLKEFGGLPFHVLREFWHEIERRDATMVTKENIEPKEVTGRSVSYWDALIGTLPFILFGIASIIGKLRLPFWVNYADLVFYVIVLLGLLIGLIKGVPRWTYSYLGWSLVFAWWWSSMGTYGLKIFGFQINYWTWQIWPPLLVAIGIALIWTRSLHPLRQLILNIWQDWTLASFMMYAFIAFMGLIYDENHHPLLFLFMTLSTIVISIAAWAYLSSTNLKKNITSLLLGFVLSLSITWICESTWDWYAYYGFPRPTAVVWYLMIFKAGIIGGLILFWPALVGAVRRAVNNRRVA